MSIGYCDTSYITAIADSIRKKKGTTDKIMLENMPTEISTIEAKSPEQEKSVDITSNGTLDILPDDGYLLSKVSVNTDVAQAVTLNTKPSGSASLAKIIKSCDLTGVDTSSVTDMQSMFSSCSSLTSLTLPESFNTSSVTNMQSMFSSCSSLTSLDLSSFNTSSVTNMYSMFYYCSSLTSLDLSSFDTSSVTNMSHMLFYNSGSIQFTPNLILGTDWASNSSITSLKIYAYLSSTSISDLATKLATRTNSPSLTVYGGTTSDVIETITNKGWTVSGLSTFVEADSASKGQYSLIDGHSYLCVYKSNTVQSWGQRIFISLDIIADPTEWDSSIISNARETSIGTGLSNSNAAMELATFHDNKENWTVWDWLKYAREKLGNTNIFVPSAGEWNIMYNHDIVYKWYWTSSEATDTNAYTATYNQKFSIDKNTERPVVFALYI